MDEVNPHSGITLVYLGRTLSFDASLAEEELANDAVVTIMLNDSLALWRHNPIRWRTFRISSSCNTYSPPKLVPLGVDRMLIHRKGSPYFELMGASELTPNDSPVRFPTGEKETEVNGTYPGLVSCNIPMPISFKTTINFVRIIAQTAYIWLGNDSDFLNLEEQPDHKPHFKLSPLNAKFLSQLNLEIYQDDNVNNDLNINNKMDACNTENPTISNGRLRIRETSYNYHQQTDCWGSYAACMVFERLENGSYQHKAKWWLKTFFSWIIALGENYLLTEATVAGQDAFYGSMRLVDVHTGHTVRHIPLRTLPLGESDIIRSTYLEPEWYTGMLHGSSQTLYVIYPECNSYTNQTLITFATPLILS